MARSRRDPFELVVHDPDFVRLKLGKNPAEDPNLAGFNLSELTDQETQMTDIYYMLMSLGEYRGRAPYVIPVSHDKSRTPISSDTVRGERLFLADIGTNPETEAYELVRKHKEGCALITFRSGLVNINGSTALHIQDIVSNGGRVGFHGPIPLTHDTKVVGEAIEITTESKVYIDDRVGRIKGVAGVPRKRVATLEAVVGGPILYKRVNGMLTLHVLTKDGWRDPVDLTGVKQWEQAYYDEMMKDTDYLAALEEDTKKIQRQRKFRVIKAPIDHDDG